MGRKRSALSRWGAARIDDDMRGRARACSPSMRWNAPEQAPSTPTSTISRPRRDRGIDAALRGPTRRGVCRDPTRPGRSCRVGVERAGAHRCPFTALVGEQREPAPAWSSSIRAAPPRRERGSFSPHRAGTDHRAVLRLLAHLAIRVRSIAPISTATPAASRRRSRRARDIGPDVAATASDRPRSSMSRPSSNGLSRRREPVTCNVAGRQPVGARHDKVDAIINCISRPAGSAARHGLVLAHRPAQRHGRT